MMFVCLASRHAAHQLGFDDGERFVSCFLAGGGERGRKKRWRQRDVGAAQPSSAYLFSSLRPYVFFFSFLPPSFPPIYKSINVRGYVLCHCSVFKSLKRDVVCATGRIGGVHRRPKSPPALKVAHRGGKKEKEGKKRSRIKARDRKAVNKSGYPRMSGDEVSH